MDGEATIDNVILDESSRRYSMAFENGFHFGVFFAYFKLKQLEIQNVVWFADLVSMKIPKNQPGWNKFTVPFKYFIGANGGYE
jgi:vacuolar-type H+-ATPase subunit C/Vma6